MNGDAVEVDGAEVDGAEVDGLAVDGLAVDGDQAPGPTLRVVHGAPTVEQLAAVVAVLSAPRPGVAAARSGRSRWSDPAARLRRPLPTPGPGAWRAVHTPT